MERNLGWNNFCVECGNTSPSESTGKNGIGRCRKRKARRNTRSVVAAAPFKEVLEQVQWRTVMDCDAHMMRCAYYAGRSGNWECFKEEFRKKKKRE